MNVMLTCAGRRSYCVEFFKQAVGDQRRVFACDSSADAPALQKADKVFVVPRIDHEDYIDALLAICDDHRIGLLVLALGPSFYCWRNTGSAFLRSGRFHSCQPRRSLLLVTTNWRRLVFLPNCGLQIPHTFDSFNGARVALSRGDITFPLVVKPRWGASSIGMQFPEDE